MRDKRNKGYFVMDDAYINGYAKKLGVHATSVYMSLCRHADSFQIAFPSQKLIAKETGMSERTVRDKILLLQKYNLVHVERERNSSGEWMRNTYTLLDKTEWLNYPEAGVASSNSPEATDDIHQRQELPIKVTNTKKVTNTLSYASIKNIGLEEMQQIADNYQVPIAFVKSKYDDMINWHESNGKNKKNWLATLRNWVKGDAIKIKERSQNVGKRGIDARQI